MRRRIALAVAGITAAIAAAFGVLAPPEDCPSVTVPALQESAAQTVDWFARNQNADGTWLYLYQADTATVPVDYNVVRHMGVQMSLYQAASAGVSGALETADRGLEWSLDRIVPYGDVAAVSYRGQTAVGTAALLVAGLVERRELTGEQTHDEVLRELGAFLAAQTEPTGAVLAYYDAASGSPVAGEYSKYYTGEAYWALARLHLTFPDEGWGQTTDLVGAYLAGERDNAEGHWLLPDHWAAYGLSETILFAERGDSPLTGDELAYARRQAGLFGNQVRWVSQQAGPWGEVVRGSRELRGGGYGVIGEALTGLWRVASAEPRLADVRSEAAERAMCIAGLAARAQADAGEAAAFAEPDRVQGAWFRAGETRMDDQQHALSALLRTIPIVEAEESPGLDAPPAWMWLVALVAAINPARLALGLPRTSGAPPAVARVAALGGLVAGGVVLAVAALSGPLLDALGVSESAMRIAAGVIGGVAGLVAVVRRAPAASPSLPGWRAALVPVAVPFVLSPALLMLGLSAGADRGVLLVGSGLVIGVGALLALAAFVGPDGVSGRVLMWAGRLTAAVLVAASVLLVIDGLFAV